MTHGYEFFEYDYFDLDISDFFDDLFVEYEKTTAEMWGEIEKLYDEMIAESEEFDIYEQDEEEEMF